MTYVTSGIVIDDSAILVAIIIFLLPLLELLNTLS